MRPKVVKSVHYCPATRKTIERKYTDLTSLEPFPTSGVYPTKVRHGSTCFTVITKTKLSSSSFSSTITRMKRGIPWRRSLACLSTETTRPSASRRCQRRLLQDSFLVPSRSSLTTTWWTSARCVNSDPLYPVL